MEQVLVARDVHHRYGATVALAGVDVTVGRGQCVALLGPNGAGKTSLVGLATGLLRRQHGLVRVAGGDPRHAVVRRRLGVVQQSIGFPRTLTVQELVRGAAIRAGSGPQEATTVLAEVGIGDLARRRAGKLSGGQQQRLQLAMALVGEPDLLLLDEPTVGLDVNARRAFWRTIGARRDRGTGVLLTTHLVEEAAAVADQVIVLDRGRVVAVDTPTNLTSRLPDRTISARTATGAAELLALPGVARVRSHEGRMVLASTEPEDSVRALLALDPELSDLRVESASLEQVLIELTGGAEPIGPTDPQLPTDTQEVAA